MCKKIGSYIVIFICGFLTYQFSYAAGACGIASWYQFLAGATTGDVISYGLCPTNTTGEDYAVYSWTSINSLVLSWDNFNWNCYFTDIQQSQSSYQSCSATRLPLSWVCGYTINSWSLVELQSTTSSLCQIGTSTWFSAIPIILSPLYLAQYNWSCQGSLSTNPMACVTYRVMPPAPGMCNSGINNQSFSYTQIQNATLCTQGLPSVTLLSPTPSNNQRTWSCLGLWWASDVSCSANKIENGICATYNTPQSSIPSNLCIWWSPSLVVSTTWAYQRTCNGINWWISSSLCTASCVGSSCSMTTTNTWSTNTWSNTITTWSTSTWSNTITTWSNGQTTPISFNLVCTDPDGCVCYNVTIVNWSLCLANNFTGVTDSIITPITIGVVCTDADGCMCNGLNTIVNGWVCQTDGMTWYLPGLSDVSVYQTVTSGTITRRWQIDITINYINRGPNIATGAKLEYYLSPLVSKIRTSAPYVFSQISASGYIQSSDYQNNVLVFPLWDIPVGENGAITISLTLNASLTDEELINATSINSRVKDSKPLDNAQKMILSFETQTATNLGNYIFNPLLVLQQIMQQYNTMNKWLSINPVFSDVQKWKDSYMSVMTVVRNGIFEGYQYTHSRKFEWDKCSTRYEVITVLARMMYTAGSTDVYVSRPSWTAYIDMNGFSSQTQNFINWAHERGLISFLNPKNIRWTLYLEPNKTITEGELKEMISSIYTRYGLNAEILEDLLNDENSCVTRLDFADAITTILRGNPNILMGYNDEFIKTIIDKTYMMSIIDRRNALQKIIEKLQITAPTLLYENGYDWESLLDILESAMNWKEYNPIVESSDASVSLAESL